MIRRDEQSRLLIGVMPALSGPFIQQATSRFLNARQPNVFCSVQSRSSQWIADGLVTRKLDVGLIIVPVENPYIVAEPLLSRPVVCALPLGHRLAEKAVITPTDLDGVPFISFEPESHTHRRVSQAPEPSVVPNVVMSVNVAPTLCEFVAAGVGVSLVHPLIVGGLRDRMAIRPFEPAVQLDFQLCRIRDSRNARLVDAFLEGAREAAAERIARTISSGRTERHRRNASSSGA